MEDILTILVPVYNEEACIMPLFIAMNKLLDQTSVSIQVLFINDGSDDMSAEEIESVCKQDRRYSYISLERNSGLSTALKAGIDHCKTPFVGYMDADLQTSPEDFPKLMEFMKNYDLVTGYFRQAFKEKIALNIACQPTFW